MVASPILLRFGFAAREKALNDYGLRPFAAREWEKVAEGRMRALV